METSGYTALAAAVLNAAVADLHAAQVKLKRSPDAEMQRRIRQRLTRLAKARKSAGLPPLSASDKNRIRAAIRSEVIADRRELESTVQEASTFLISPSIWHEWLDVKPEACARLLR